MTKLLVTGIVLVLLVYIRNSISIDILLVSWVFSIHYMPVTFLRRAGIINSFNPRNYSIKQTVSLSLF